MGATQFVLRHNFISSINIISSFLAVTGTAFLTLFFFFLSYVCTEKALFGEGEWYFFSPRDRKYPKGERPNRAAGLGYWKATGSDQPIFSSFGSEQIGVKKSLVFYAGRPQKGTKTDWFMNEYRLLDSSIKPPNLKGSMRVSWIFFFFFSCSFDNKLEKVRGLSPLVSFFSPFIKFTVIRLI